MSWCWGSVGWVVAGVAWVVVVAVAFTFFLPLWVLRGLGGTGVLLSLVKFGPPRGGP